MNHVRMLCLALVLLALGMDMASAQERTAPMAIHSVSVQLPAGLAEFPPGPGVDVAGKCLICHSADMVLKQPLMSEAAWKGVINKMRSAYGAPITDDDVNVLTAYMARINAEQQTP
ncbi:cytochrome c [Dyella halodurans]|uniref:Cytochrome c n=1 Tax=Dyella halodurans TaxID=1920171 RepID=A0ABV9C7A9_9GAMM|nr:hypothetical protein [Dyella halodurans]